MFGDTKPANAGVQGCNSSTTTILVEETGVPLGLMEKLTVASFSISSSVAPRDASPMSWEYKSDVRIDLQQDLLKHVGACQLFSSHTVQAST